MCSTITFVLLAASSTEINKAPTVKTAAALFQQICYENKDRLMAGIIVGGWDPIEKGSLYSIPLGGMILFLLVCSLLFKISLSKVCCHHLNINNHLIILHSPHRGVCA